MTLKIAGNKFGRLTAIERVGSDTRKKALWRFACDCGAETTLPATLVVSGHTTSCGCLRTDMLREAVGLNLAGERVGRLLVVSEAGRDQAGAITWNCVCDCGNECVVTGKRIKSGNTTSCGCRKKEAALENCEARIIDYVGRRYGRLVVIGDYGVTAAGIKRVKCVCDCGGERISPINSLSSGKAVSCGCAHSNPVGSPLMPENARMYSATRNSLRRANKRGAGGAFTKEEIDNLYRLQKGKCACCRCEIDNGFHRDHVNPLALGGSNSIDNIQLLCPTCNGRKGAKSPAAWAIEMGKLL